jgi:hypothetical protein
MDYAYLNDKEQSDSVTASARVVVPLLMQWFKPASVVDFGCGAGGWLDVFREHGVPRLQGYDGPWVPAEILKIPAGCFQSVDLRAGFPPVQRFDLAMSVEVGEHIAPQTAEALVDFLCASADVVFWSSAVPGQGGFEHINERWQEDWVQTFGARGFEAFDLVRPVVWHDARVSFWYRQNGLVFANEAGRRRHGLMHRPFVASVVHPEMYQRDCDPRNYSLKTVIRHFPHYLARRFSGRRSKA